jgi:hypothetical protein
MKMAGITRVGIGMETMEKKSLQGVSKKTTPRKTRQAVDLLGKARLEAKLFHVVFPGKFSEKTIRFLMELSESGIPFKIQSSFLRSLPDRNSRPEFSLRDQTTYFPGKDTVEQLMECLLANMAFPSTNIKFNEKGDPALRRNIKLLLERGISLKSLFKKNRFGLELRYAVIHTYKPGLVPAPFNTLISPGPLID